jgi:hypothetical protein
MKDLPDLPPARKALVSLGAALVAVVVVVIVEGTLQASILTAPSSTNVKISIFGLRRSWPAPVAIDGAAFGA